MNPYNISMIPNWAEWTIKRLIYFSVIIWFTKYNQKMIFNQDCLSAVSWLRPDETGLEWIGIQNILEFPSKLSDERSIVSVWYFLADGFQNEFEVNKILSIREELYLSWWDCSCVGMSPNSKQFWISVKIVSKSFRDGKFRWPAVSGRQFWQSL